MNGGAGDFFYLDANASEPLRPEAAAAMAAAAAVRGNPSSVHRAGRAARAIMEAAREEIAATFGVTAENCVMTSGGTEANVLAIDALGQGRRILYGAGEHDAVRMAAQARGGQAIPVDAQGVVRLDALAALLAQPGEALVCMMLANNETGVIQPVAEVARLCREHGARLHVDAVQAAGRMEVDLRALGADSMAVSGHKFGGPKGAGALLLAGERFVALPPMLAGGGQEQGRRGGTPALPAIAGMAAALSAATRDLADPAHRARLARLRDGIDRAARDCGAVVCSADAPRLANTTCLVLPHRRAQTQLIALDMAGFCVSAGSACSSGKVARSHVLVAMGMEGQAGCAIRVSLPWSVTDAEVEAFTAAYADMAARLPMREAV
ncbi:aminotransferase class V-fold PLP-dependent enzyme [Gluconacetobacter entanii]|uniref:Cysteine desulfurase n=1 Tax=Gluconacetobacter entanii TaxID=108528 RepID=A0ABT3K8G3_9PROT|nr:aminotransferase class V-fold PLP-dependent enzyme [Gluconacetobacter entanii]MCW4591734.1 aminotransferase class V-fold PLP-dependent enzyme [Gluconacetobacter entanii]MCW4593571.1 aminotransferase class V-fold PLP-dependent enzyme [Gluconacetobacter entanii]NPC88032.1 aminotransferase class V-fold PLP-dependent enzyme [Gluconacetobacter entanii]